jgi:predicted AlkP superfamily pyrophosphatase or phosphodiesterase
MVTILLLPGSFVNLSAQNHKKIPSEKPKLIVIMVIDQLRYDYIYRFWDKFVDNGIKKMVQEGTFCKNAEYNYLLNETSVGHATLSTGSYPSHHGIIADQWYVSLRDEIVYCVSDDRVSTVGGSYESGRYSPANLLSSTIGDELKLSNNFRSRVMGIALDNNAAILSAGHSADYAFWYDPGTGKWITSSWYTDSLPDWVNEFNDKKLPDTYLDRTWETMLPLETYTEHWPDTNILERGFGGRSFFPYNLNSLSLVSRNTRNYEILKSTPFGNMLTKDFAIAAILNDSLGQDEYTDIIAIGFSANEYIGRRFGSNSVEMEDAVLRLDSEIAHFLDFLDEYIGKENTLVILTADHGLTYHPGYLDLHRIPSGEFNYKSAVSLLASYMNIIYGKGDWVKYYYAQQLYLNHELIEDSQIDLEEIQNRVERFMVQFEGVSNATTSVTLQTTSFSDGIFRKIQNGFHQKRSGDVIISLAPGWVEKDDPASSYHSSYIADNHVPLVWYGWKIKRSSINRPVNMIDVVPTISSFLEISRPNASTGEIILELVE